jgi:hypothetical protein
VLYVWNDVISSGELEPELAAHATGRPADAEHSDLSG